MVLGTFNGFLMQIQAFIAFTWLQREVSRSELYSLEVLSFRMWGKLNAVESVIDFSK